MLNRARMLQHIEEVLRRGENRPVLAKCFCGKAIATHFATYIDSQTYKYLFGTIHCDECKDEIPLDKPMPLAIRFSSFDMVPQIKDTQRRLLKIFKYCFFLDENIKITKRVAQKLFFPELFGKTPPSEKPQSSPKPSSGSMTNHGSDIDKPKETQGKGGKPKSLRAKISKEPDKQLGLFKE